MKERKNLKVTKTCYQCSHCAYYHHGEEIRYGCMFGSVVTWPLPLACICPVFCDRGDRPIEEDRIR